jgi:hypothetical protein
MKTTERVEILANAREVPESEILREALEKGVKNLWDEYVLSKYIKGELDREEAVDLVGLRKVKRADKGMNTVREDVKWGMEA